MGKSNFVEPIRTDAIAPIYEIASTGLLRPLYTDRIVFRETTRVPNC